MTLSVEHLSANSSLIESVVADVSRRIAGRRRPRHRPTSGTMLWTAVANCILSSAVKYESVVRATLALETAGLGTAALIAKRRSASRLRNILKSSGYRFPVSRGLQLWLAAKSYSIIEKQLASCVHGLTDAIECRKWLVASVQGLGPKQASMLITSVTPASLAVLDTHILAFLQLVQALPSRGTPNVASLKGYERVEEAYLSYAQSIGVPPTSLDKTIWVVMRSLR